MKPFAYARARTLEDARRRAAGAASYLMGGTGLIDLMKVGVEAPETVIDLNHIDGLDALHWRSDGALEIGAAVRMSRLARDARVGAEIPVLHDGLLAGATPQLRNMASISGNLLQRARCSYFRDTGFAACNKRAAGTGCAALAGVNAEHAIIGWSTSCVAVHPSDLAVALLTADAEIVTDRRWFPLASLHRLPGTQPERETELQPFELITAVVVPRSERLRRSAYAKSPEGGFAHASAAVALDVRDGRIASSRVVLGGVAHAPWRSHEAENVLHDRTPDSAVFREAAEAALAPARPLAMNAYKIPLLRSIIAASLEAAAAR